MPIPTTTPRSCRCPWPIRRSWSPRRSPPPARRSPIRRWRPSRTPTAWSRPAPSWPRSTGAMPRPRRAPLRKSGSTYSVIASHTYAVSGTYTIVTTVVEPVPVAASHARGRRSRISQRWQCSVRRTVRWQRAGSARRHRTELRSDSFRMHRAVTSTERGPPRPASRSPHAMSASMIVLPDGRLLVFGGVQNGVTPLNDGQIYNPVTDSWTSMANFPGKHALAMVRRCSWPTAACWPVRSMDANTYIYDPASDSWSAGPTKLYRRQSDSRIVDAAARWQHPVVRREQQSRGSPTARSHDDDVGRCGQRARRAGSGHQRLPEYGARCAAARWSGLAIGAFQQHRDLHAADSRRWHERRGKLGCWSRHSGWFGSGWATTPAGGSTAALLPNGHVLFEADMPDSGGPTRFFEFDPTAPLATSLTDVTPPDVQLPDQFGELRHTDVGASHRAGALGKCQSLWVHRPVQSAVRLHAQRYAASGLEADDHERRRQWQPLHVDRHAAQRPVGRSQPRHQHANGHQLSASSSSPTVPGTSTSRERSTGAAPAWPRAARR